MLPIAEQEALIQKMMALYPRTHGPECADKYRAIAEWWRFHAEETRAPEECLQYAINQDIIADDMEARPTHYLRRPLEKSAYEWSKMK